MKSPSDVSNQWGSYFVDVQKNEGEETQRLTWCCRSIHTYSTMAIPSIEAIAGIFYLMGESESLRLGLKMLPFCVIFLFKKI